MSKWKNENALARPEHQRRRLPSELVALIHHVELSKAGWRDHLIDQLVVSSMFIRATPCGVEELRASLGSDFSLTVDDRAFHQSVKRLLASRSLIEIDDGRLKLAERAAEDAQSTIMKNESLEERVAVRFKAIITEEAKELDRDDCWRRFCDDCLDPLVTELGARTYELIAVPAGGGPDVHSVAASSYVDSYPQEVRKAIQKSIDRFLDPTDADVRSFVLSRLQSHLLTLAASLSEQSLADLAAKTKSNLQLKLFLDTNFLFSVLDLHDNPANAVAQDLIRLLGDVENHVRSKLYVFPLTMDELTRTLSKFRRELSDVAITPRLGRIAMNTTVGQGNGVRARFLRAAASATHRLTALDYFNPYISNLLTVLRGKGLELYNENVEALTTSQGVLDDILAENEHESQRPVEHRKKYKAIRHDVALWHFVSQKRSMRVDSPLDAMFWAVTIDYRLLHFDKRKTKHQGANTVPICVHPAVLIQMLQLWLPRTPQFDEAMLQGVRVLLPLPTDTEVEEVTLRILRTLSRFEDVDDLPDETISSVLLDRALRIRMEEQTEAEEQDKLVRDALVGQLATAKEELREERVIRSVVEEGLRGARNRADDLEHKTRKGLATTQQLQLELQQERESRQDLERKLKVLEEEAENHKAEARRQEDSLRSWHRVIFVIAALLLLVLAEVVILRLLGGEATGDQGLGSKTMAGLVIIILWTLMVGWVGQQFQNVNAWGPFNVFHRVKIWLVGFFVTIIGGLLAILIWERW